MTAALYHPEHGYYAGSPRRIGRSGDFYTAVSVGALYGRLISRLAESVWEHLGRPEPFTLVEQAGHDGQLMEDVLAGLAEGGGGLAGQVNAVMIEPQAGYRAVQRRRLVEQGGWSVSWVDGAPDLATASRTQSGVFFCNELLDAMPVHRVQWTGEAWKEIGVAFGESGALQWKAAPITEPSLVAEVARLPVEAPSGWTTEVCPAAVEWMRGWSSVPFEGVLMIADYGLDRAERFHPGREEGTLRRYHSHRMDDRVLDDLGNADLTWHIDFTSLMEQAEADGWTVVAYEEQGRFLTRLAAPWLRGLEGSPPDSETRALLRQFHSLTHPGIMGRSFRVLLLGKGIRGPLFGA